ncbi:DDE-type integrase/transposase/recombinase [Candidatus Poriferisodalis sp.]|uniref:DDE-type integrase/transposase/recombinase n=1 Tax=Candidatus Poriferisodalis sp. TaxID=3101277 RepID=UPI003AF41DD1
MRTGEGWLYLAVVLDLGSRRLLGHQMSERIDTRLVADALDMAANTRAGRTAGIVFHSDRGSQAGFKGSSQHRAVEESVGVR